jgi:hypothetical protein
MSQDIGIARTYVLGFGLTASWVLVRVSVRCLVVLGWVDDQFSEQFLRWR